jgi:predicted Zn-ribbon and HTH transcriptional regulator
LGVAVAMKRKVDRLSGWNFRSVVMKATACRNCGCYMTLGVVRERNCELALVDFECQQCGFKWSDCKVVSSECKVGDLFHVKNPCEVCVNVRS